MKKINFSLLIVLLILLTTLGVSAYGKPKNNNINVQPDSLIEEAILFDDTEERDIVLELKNGNKLKLRNIKNNQLYDNEKYIRYFDELENEYYFDKNTHLLSKINYDKNILVSNETKNIGSTKATELALTKASELFIIEDYIIDRTYERALDGLNYTLVYMSKHINGIPTLDALKVTINNDGDVVSIVKHGETINSKLLKKLESKSKKLIDKDTAIEIANNFMNNNVDKYLIKGISIEEYNIDDSWINYDENFDPIWYLNISIEEKPEDTGTIKSFLKLLTINAYNKKVIDFE